MSDQQRRMEEGSLRSVTFRGGQADEKSDENFWKIRKGVQIILTNTEVLQSVVQEIKQKIWLES